MNVETTGYNLILVTAYAYLNNSYCHGFIIYSPCASSSSQLPSSIWYQTGYNTSQQITTINISYNSNRHWISAPYGAKIYVYGMKQSDNA